ncbi:hypothetical protein RJ639_036599 [Escallonia herrerae]|uniref:Bulb-type lectin domain-containing protein n=1 Tax=Escallonia herrerae TaxID=1293975 RepID=A0AA89B7F3_9ASTE|nr:hypothetical protein RJ639_036599 [Escallonia herrerae]
MGASGKSHQTVEREDFGSSDSKQREAVDEEVPGAVLRFRWYLQGVKKQDAAVSKSLINLSTATDTLTSIQSVNENGTLVSPRGKFQLGFFSPGSSKKRYVGIWYNNIPNQTIVWVANRENPLNDPLGVLKIGSDGNLLLLDQTEQVVWSTKIQNISSVTTALQLLDSGNLVLKGAQQPLVWNSSILEWLSMPGLRRDQCDDYAHRGPNSNCATSDPRVCRCLTGYVPKSSQDWDMLLWYGGCIRENPLNCPKGEGFIELTAYASASGAGSGCLLWFGDLIDIRKLKEYGNQKLYVRAAATGQEYATDGIYSVKSDVFSFGVLVLEIVSGKRNREFHYPEHDFNLLGHAWKLRTEEKALQLVDPQMEDSFPMPEVLRCIQVGLLCVQQRPDDRPPISSVLLMLDTENAMLSQPKLLGFYTGRRLNETEHLLGERIIPATNEMTNTLLFGR